MGKIYVPTRRGIEDWRQLLINSKLHWKSGCSAESVASSWEHADGLPPEIANLIGGSPELLLAIPEHKVGLPGHNSDSRCDVFALVKVKAPEGSKDETMAVTVEAKKNESFGETIGDWWKEPSDGKKQRLDFICELLDIESHPPNRLYYQLFHRTAAAILEARKFGTDRAAMIVQSFSSENRGYKNFREFAEFLNMRDEFGGKRATKKLKSGLPLTLGWASGSAENL